MAKFIGRQWYCALCDTRAVVGHLVCFRCEARMDLDATSSYLYKSIYLTGTPTTPVAVHVTQVEMITQHRSIAKNNIRFVRQDK